jgi:hypothetical protein
VRGPDDAPLTPIKIEPQDFHDVAQTFIDGSTTAYQVVPTLFRVLDGFRGPAGIDQSARQFDASYRPAVQTLVNGINSAVGLLGDIGVGIDTAARNHWNADEAAVPNSGLPSPPWTPVDPGLVLPQEPVVPSLVGSPTVALPSPLDQLVPMGHTDDVRTVARAFETARDDLTALAEDLHGALESLFVNNQSADLDALNDFWNQVGGTSSSAILSALPEGCDSIATALYQFADWVDDTQNELDPIVRTPDLWHPVATRKDVRHACSVPTRVPATRG